METNKKTKTKAFFYQREYSSYVEIDLSNPLHNELAYLFFDRDLSNPKWCPGVFPGSIRKATELMKKIEGFVGKPDASNLYLKVYNLDENGKVIGTYKKKTTHKTFNNNLVPFTTTIKVTEEDYICDYCLDLGRHNEEEHGPLMDMELKVNSALDLIFCRFCHGTQDYTEVKD
jgi:hypothetical protein